MMRQLTDKQRQVLAVIDALETEIGFVPSIQEIADRYGTEWKHAIRQHLKALERKGYVHRLPNRSRAMRIVRRDDAGAELIAGVWIDRKGGDDGAQATPGA